MDVNPQISSPEDTRVSDVYARGFVGLAAMNQLGNVPPAAAYAMIDHMAAHPEAASRMFPFVDLRAGLTDVYEHAYGDAAARRALEVGQEHATLARDARVIAYSTRTGMTRDSVAAALAPDAPAASVAEFYGKLYGRA